MTDALVVSVPEAAALLGMSDDLVYKLLDEGRLPEIPRVSRRRLIPRRAVELLVETAMEDFDPSAALATLRSAS